MKLPSSVLSNTISVVYDIIIGEETANRFAHISKSISSMVRLLNLTNAPKQALKYKTLNRDEILYHLVEVISKIVNYFLSIDPELINDLSPDAEEPENTYKDKKLRAKAVFDFMKYEDHELGFVRNNIITLLNCKDEHCWVGELNGKIGWFPAKLVRILDERTKSYCCAGDDGVSKIISPMIRENLCPVIEQLLKHGMKPRLLRHKHPWYFFREVAMRIANYHLNGVFTRLVLCKTYKLEDQQKLLSPEDLLYRCIHMVELSHSNMCADVKFRSLICVGLNEQALHLWLEVLWCCDDVVEKWYHDWALLRSPQWIQIKNDLQVLSRLPFNLDLNWELPVHENKELVLKNAVKDMLLKYHLFSWDI